MLIKGESNLSVSGTSNLHDWQVNAEEFSMDLKMSTEKTLVPVIDKVLFSCQAASITSDNSIMTNKAINALQADKNPEIIFKSDTPSSLNISNGHFSSTITGELTLNGVKRKVSVPFEGNVQGDVLNIKGSKSLDMEDYSITPPTAILGALKTDKTVTVTFDFSFKVPASNLMTLSTSK